MTAGRHGKAKTGAGADGLPLFGGGRPIAPLPPPDQAHERLARQHATPGRHEDLAGLLPLRPDTWRTLLAASQAATDIVLFASDDWHGTIIEVLSDPETGHNALRADDGIEALPASSAHGRTIYLDWDAVGAIHRRCPLERIGAPGRAACRYRMARTDTAPKN